MLIKLRHHLLLNLLLIELLSWIYSAFSLLRVSYVKQLMIKTSSISKQYITLGLIKKEVLKVMYFSFHHMVL